RPPRGTCPRLVEPMSSERHLHFSLSLYENERVRQLEDTSMSPRWSVPPWCTRARRRRPPGGLDLDSRPKHVGSQHLSCRELASLRAKRPPLHAMAPARPRRCDSSTRPLSPSTRLCSATRRCVTRDPMSRIISSLSTLSRQCVVLHHRQAGKSAEPISSPGLPHGKESALPAIEPAPGRSMKQIVPLALVSVPGSLTRAPKPSRWLRDTIRLSYAIQLTRRPLKFGTSSYLSQRQGCSRASGQGHHPSGKRSCSSLWLRCSTGSAARTSSSPKKRVARSAYPEQAPTQAAVQDAHAEAHPGVYQMSRLVHGNRPEGCLLSCLAFGRAYQYRVLPFGLSLSPRVFTKIVEAALSPRGVLRMALLMALTSKRVGDLQAPSVSTDCLELGPSDSHIILRPRPGYLPKVPTTPPRDQVENLQALPSGEEDPTHPCCVQYAHCASTWTARRASDALSSSLSVLEAQQRLYFLHQLRKFNLPQELLLQFYSAVIESVLYTSITVWFGSAAKTDLRRLQRIVQTAERITGTTLPNLQELYSTRVSKRARKITLDPSHPAHFIFELLPTGQRYSALSTKTARPSTL
ncbi:hypothetical protein IRJ41_005667, partial [Triplophysa rosa]